ncbi:uncharacterized protein SCHCODRAFT_02197600 [Schizophyllum commune H4-8]|uniref:uncharacterized protein n=1 Tax=Schizophyllum commune (strain H4-8 / FGSC 9210) TaxID=578458 RepID=UPI002160C1C8|nr:uncharacterized protein SCHCODRAFT_02197600 [Schizophyllum commune H4-8]KAI5896728.1 hypothetical protein SCHCODRAFT_02197600 [Schizophyllum commune H4-8]
MLDDRHIRDRPSLPAIGVLTGNHLDLSPPANLVSQRPEFNLLVAGCSGGKSSFLRLLADTSEIASGTTQDQVAHLAKFVQTCAAPTTQLRVASLDVEPETGAPPIALGLVDTPALDARDTPAAERVLADIVRFIDTRFAEAVEDRDARRAASGDQFIHLCIYFLDPDLIVPPAAASRACRPGFPQLEPDAVLLDPSGGSPLPARPSLPRGDILAIKNLSARVNVLPVISRADVLSNARLATIKAAVRKDLADAGIGFGIFDEYAAQDTAAAADALQPELIASSRASPPTPIPRLPYALISPDIYAHSDGVQRVQPSRHDLIEQYRPSLLSRPKLLAGKYVRAYRWGYLDVLDHKHCDFMALRGAIFHHMETLRKYTRDYLFKQNVVNYRRSVHANPIAPQPPPAGSRPALAVNTGAVAQPPLAHHASMVDVGRAVEDVHLPARSLSDSLPTARALADAVPGPSTKTESRGHLRSKPRKITIACNFCRSRKLKCDGARPGCGQCEKRSHTCEYSATQRRRSGRPKAADELSDSDSVGEPSVLGEAPVMGEPSGDLDNKQIQLSPGAPPSRRQSNAADQQHPARRASNAAERRASNATEQQQRAYDHSPHNAYDGPTLPPITALARSDKGFPPSMQDGKGFNPMQMQENGFALPRGPPGRSMFPDNELPHIETLLPRGSPPSQETRSAPGMRGMGAGGLPLMVRDAPGQGMRGEQAMRERELQTRPPDSREQMQAPPARKRAATVPGKSGTGRLTSSGPKVVACDLCRSRKTKCDGGMPSCSSCARKSLPCHYANDRRQSNGAKRAPRKGTASKAPTEASGSPPAQADEDANHRPLSGLHSPPHPLKRPIDVLDTMRPPKKMKTDVSVNALAEVPPVGVGP